MDGLKGKWDSLDAPSNPRNDGIPPGGSGDGVGLRGNRTLPHGPIVSFFETAGNRGIPDPGEGCRVA